MFCRFFWPPAKRFFTPHKCHFLNAFELMRGKVTADAYSGRRLGRGEFLGVAEW